jgi:Zn-dependent protease
MDFLGPDFLSRLQIMSIQMVPFIMAVVFHEVGHGFAALKWGDSTAKDAGRLTLNPGPHLDPIGTLLFPMINMVTGIPILIGWAKPVPINPARFRKYRPGLFWVSAAGPGTNFILAQISALLFVALRLYTSKDFYLHDPLVGMAMVSVQLNYALGIFNLVPLPPLDGSKMVQSFLPYQLSEKYESLAQYSFFILLALLWTGVFRVLMTPIQALTELSITLASQPFLLVHSLL